MKILILGGCGYIGRAVVRYLVGNQDVSQLVIADIQPIKGEDIVAEVSSKKVSYYDVDINKQDLLIQAMKGFNVVLNASSHEYNLRIMNAALESRVSYIDLGGFYHITKEQLALDDEFAEKRLTAVIGMGASPGITNVFSILGSSYLDHVNEIYVRTGCIGGTGFPYSPKSVLEQVTISPIVYKNREFQVVEPLSGWERYDLLEPILEIEGFLAISSELATLPLTIEGAGSITHRIAFSDALTRNIIALREMGLLSKFPLQIKGMEMSPLEFVRQYFVSQNQSCSLDAYMSLRVDVIGEKNGSNRSVVLQAVEGPRSDCRLSGPSLLAGLSAAVTCHMVGVGRIEMKGVIPPERALEPEILLDALEREGVRFTIQEHPLS